MRNVAAFVLLAATACMSGGGRPTPSAAPSSPFRPAPSADAVRLRRLAATTMAGCPCSVSLRIGATGRDKVQRDVDVTGTWDPATSSGEYTVRDSWSDPKPGKYMHYVPPFTLRVVRGVAYVSPADRYGLTTAPWARLFFPGRPKTYDTAFALLAAADPRLSLAVLGGAAGVTEGPGDAGWTYAEDVVAAAGPAAAAARQLMAPGGPYFDVSASDDSFTYLSWSGGDAPGSISVSLDAIHGGARPVTVAAPAGAVTIDAFSVKSLTAK